MSQFIYPAYGPPIEIVLCQTERVWHEVLEIEKAKEKRVVPRGTHGGVQGERKTPHLSDELRASRAAKNLRNRQRKNAGTATRPRGTQRRGR